MHKIEFTDKVLVGGKEVSSIEVAPLTFVELVNLWDRITDTRKPEAALQRARIMHQTRFSVGKEVVQAGPEDLTVLPYPVAKSIIDALNIGQGKEGGKVDGSGNGMTSPALYKLGTPIELVSGSEKEPVVITELEFSAGSYGEMEDVLAADSEMHKALELIRICTPVGTNLSRLPGWAVDRITVADGVGVMQNINTDF